MYEKLKGARLGVKIQDFSNIAPSCHLIMEETSRLGNVIVRLPEVDRPLRIGAHTYVRAGSEIWHVESIGRFCSIGRNAILGQPPDNHPISWVSTSMGVSHDYIASCNYCTIGHDVWIAHDAVIMAGVKIHHGAVIGRNAIVTKDVGPYEIVAGNPAKIVKTRFPAKQVNALIESEWWNIDFDDLRCLPFNDVEQFLSELPGHSNPASYKELSIKNRRIC